MGRLVSHLQSVDESYFQHMQHALAFAVALFFAAVVCLLHAFLPFLFEKWGSTIVTNLHSRMVVNRANPSAHYSPKQSSDTSVTSET
ncbi:MAG: DUF6356 family protein [Proteobacteria bacterium]|nr:DUF6356 family protein [Pseudomonadota bacterium]